MKLKGLVIFKAVCEEMSMTNAAKKFGMTQPSVSQIIKEIEAHYALKVFERESKKLYITEAGRTLLKYTNRLMEVHDEMESALESLLDKREVKIGVSPIVASDYLADCLYDFYKYRKELKIHSRSLDKIDMLNSIANGDIDFAFIDYYMESKDLIVDKIYEDELLIICSKDHDFALKDSLTSSQLMGQEIWTYSKRHEIRSIIDDKLSKSKISLDIVSEIDSSNAIIKSVENGLGIAIISRSALDKNSPVFALKLSDIEMTYSLYIAYKNSKILNEDTNECINYFKNNLSFL